MIYYEFELYQFIQMQLADEHSSGDNRDRHDSGFHRDRHTSRADRDRNKRNVATKSEGRKKSRDRKIEPAKHEYHRIGDSKIAPAKHEYHSISKEYAADRMGGTHKELELPKHPHGFKERNRSGYRPSKAEFPKHRDLTRESFFSFLVNRCVIV